MPMMERAYRTTKAVFWERDSYDEDGRATYLDAREIDVRWATNRTKSVRIITSGDAVEANVVVGEFIRTDSLMWKGELAEWSGVRPDAEGNEVMKVVRYNETPDVKGKAHRTRRSVDLVKFRDSFPSTESTESLVDDTLSSVTFSTLATQADGINEILIVGTLLNSDGEPIEGRLVRSGISTMTGISFHNSPQTTDEDGTFIIVTRATSATSGYFNVNTVEDGGIAIQTPFAFV